MVRRDIGHWSLTISCIGVIEPHWPQQSRNWIRNCGIPRNTSAMKIPTAVVASLLPHNIAGDGWIGCCSVTLELQQNKDWLRLDDPNVRVCLEKFFCKSLPGLLWIFTCLYAYMFIKCNATAWSKEPEKHLMSITTMTTGVYGGCQ